MSCNMFKAAFCSTRCPLPCCLNAQLQPHRKPKTAHVKSASFHSLAMLKSGLNRCLRLCKLPVEPARKFLLRFVFCIFLCLLFVIVDLLFCSFKVSFLSSFISFLFPLLCFFLSFLVSFLPIPSFRSFCPFVLLSCCLSLFLPLFVSCLCLSPFSYL